MKNWGVVSPGRDLGTGIYLLNAVPKLVHPNCGVFFLQNIKSNNPRTCEDISNGCELEIQSRKEILAERWGCDYCARLLAFLCLCPPSFAGPLVSLS